MKSNQLQKNIPKEWQIKQIKDICDNFDNKRVPISKEKREKGNIPYFGATGIVDYVSGYIFDEELLLIGEDGADWSKFANTAYLINGKSWVNNHAHVLKCMNVNSVFLENYLNFNDLNSYITGGTRGKLTKGILEKIPVILPTIAEQKKIAEILSKVDEEINKTNELISKTEKLKNGLMNNLFTKGINHKKFKKTKLGEIPEDWEIRKLEEICDVRDGTHNSPKYHQDGVPLITSKNLTDSGLDFNNIDLISKSDFIEIEKRSHVDDGDILFGMIGTIGNPVLINKNREFAIKNVALIKFINKGVSNVFILHSLKSNYMLVQFNKKLGGSTQKFIALGKIRELDILVPKYEEQQKISEILSSVDKKLDKQKELKEKLTQLKKGLMSDLLSGKIRVNI